MCVQFRRLTGGKRKRGRDPRLNDLIEIMEDDVKVEIESYRKHHSEETVDNLYKPVSVLLFRPHTFIFVIPCPLTHIHTTA